MILSMRVLITAGAGFIVRNLAVWKSFAPLAALSSRCYN